jgi:hypothetical protein
MIAAVLLMVDVEVFGFLHVISAKLNSLSLVNLGIVIGMSSEFTYLARCFLAVDGTKNERVGKALELTLEPLLHGLGTQIAATFPLIFLKYHAFRVYYFAMFTLMGVLGFINGFVFFPVFLSMLGPASILQRQKMNPIQRKTVVEYMSQCADTLKKLMTHRFGWVFNEPVDPIKLNIPDYFKIITKPMDLGTIRSRLDKEWYSTPMESLLLSQLHQVSKNPKVEKGRRPMSFNEKKKLSQDLGELPDDMPERKK